MSLFDDRSCGCGQAPHPETASIPAGLAALAQRQRAGFPEYREAMLRAIPAQPNLDGWRARGEADLGVMLIEGWSYVLDVTGFYDARIAERAYIGTTPDALGAQRLTGLLGYQPRGAIAATVELAVEIDGADPLLIPRGAGFRSEAFGKEPPQVFEVDADSWAWPQRNRWRLAPMRDPLFDGVLRFLPRGAPPAGSVILVTAGATKAAARIASVEPETGPDDARYQRLALSQGGDSVAALAGAAMADIGVSILRLPLALNGFAASSVVGELLLDSLYPQLLPGSVAAVEIGGVFTAVTITAAAPALVTIDSATLAKMTVTKVMLSPPVSRPAVQPFILHAGPVAVGAPAQFARTAIFLADIELSGALVAPVKPLGEAPAGGQVLLAGKRKQGVALDGALIELAVGAASRFQTGQGAAPFEPALEAPVDLFGNVVKAVRGETVIDEAIGSANAAEPFNRFTLAKKPLVWREDPAQPGGRRPDLTVRVDGLVWTRVDSFFGQPAGAEVYVVRSQPDGGAVIMFGDGKRCARPPSGVDNVRAGYRFGAGAATPPPGAINQIVRSIKTLASVRGPVAAVGGADPETADELRSAAPAAALTIGRAVSLADFEALARSFSGIVNASAAWAWDQRRQRAVAKLWVISRGGGPSASLANWLSAQSAPDLAILVEAAPPAPFGELTITLDVAPRHDPVVVVAAARDALFNPDSGLLAPAKQRIGAPLFRSAVTGRLHQVAGVAGVDAILLDGVAMPKAVAPGMGRWFDLEAGTIVR
jgi:predicted phage baseplate assembly protein